MKHCGHMKRITFGTRYKEIEFLIIRNDGE